jgi:hypothetical protein
MPDWAIRRHESRYCDIYYAFSGAGQGHGPNEDGTPFGIGLFVIPIRSWRAACW